MDRRSFLATLTGSTPVLFAGCLSNGEPSGSPTPSPAPSVSPSGSCDAVEITRASVSVDYGCDTGAIRTGRVTGRVEECEADLRLEVLDEDELLDEVPLQADPNEWSVGFGEGPGQIRAIPGPGDHRVRVRDSDGTVLASVPLAVSHYLDEPNLSVWRPAFEPETVSVGDEVAVEFSVATFGAGASFTAGLLVDGDAVGTREGTVESGTDCQTASGPTYEFSHGFDEPGTYELAGRISVDGSSTGGETMILGTVTVTE